MGKIDITKAPYYQREKSEDNTQLLYKPGMHLQNQELNEQQAISKRIVKDVADSLLKDGDIISGAQLIINDKIVTVTDGKIYVEGIVRYFKEQSLTITGIGKEIIGVKLFKEIITSHLDKDLLSPATGFPGYGLPGADRLKETLILTLNDPDAIPLYVLEDGNLVNQVKNDESSWLDRLYAILARRTMDESGHYKVRGNELSQKNQYDDNYLYLTMSEGKSYVEGWEIEKKVATTIPVEKSTTTRNVKAEPKIYTEGTSKYKLNNVPVALINRVTSEVPVSTTLTRQGAINGSDPIPGRYSPVVDIQTITQVTDGVTYVKGKDFVLEADTVRWMAGGKQPDIGATYNITFTYNKQMEDEKDYKLTLENGEYFVELLEGGDKPVKNTQMQIDYDFYLHYIASITMDRHGQVRVVKGQPDTANNVSQPNITDQSVLLMGYVYVTPLNDELKVTNTRSTRSSMARIQKMFERLEDMEINQAITDLDKEALEGEEATLLRGILTDGFLGLSKSDINHEEYTASINPVEGYLTLGYTNEVNELTLNTAYAANYNKYSRLVTGKSNEYVLEKQPYATKPYKINPYTVYEKEKELHNITVVPVSGATITTTPATRAKEGEIVTVNVEITGENLAFKEFLIDGAKMTGNSFTMPDHHVTVTVALKDITPIPPTKYNIIVIPKDDTEISTLPAFNAKEGEIVKVNAKSTHKDILIEKILLDGAPINADTFTMPNRQVTVTVSTKDVAPKVAPTILLKPAIDNWIDEKTVTVKEENITRVTQTTTFRTQDNTQERRLTGNNKTEFNGLIETAIEHMRIRDIEVTGQRFKANQDDIIIKFNDVKVPATPLNNTYKSSKDGYLKADENGVVKAKIKVPARTQCGTVGVEILSEEYSHLTGLAPYTAIGTLKTEYYREIIGVRLTTYRFVEPSRNTDPLAQTFLFEEDQMLSSVGLFFSKIDLNDPITIQIRETDNGYPANVILAEKIIPVSDLRSSEDGSVETKIMLHDPVYCKAYTSYAVTILTESTESSLYIQSLGEVDLATKQQVVQNPYIKGVMFSSSNALTWNAHQRENLKFNLYCNDFTEESIVYFNSINGVDYDAIKILANTSVPVDTKLEWEYSSNDGATWLPIPVRETLELHASINKVTIRAIITAKKNVSPAIDVESILLIGMKNKEKSSYLTRNVTTDAKFKEVKIVADIYNPSGTGVVFYYATDISGKTWKPLNQVGEPKVKEVGGYSEYTYSAKESIETNNFRAKVSLTTNNSTIKPKVQNLKCIMKQGE